MASLLFKVYTCFQDFSRSPQSFWRKSDENVLSNFQKMCKVHVEHGRFLWFGFSKIDFRPEILLDLLGPLVQIWSKMLPFIRLARGSIISSFSGMT